jgi:hypothetical protein
MLAMSLLNRMSALILPRGCIGVCDSSRFLAGGGILLFSRHCEHDIQPLSGLYVLCGGFKFFHIYSLSVLC